MGDRKKLAQYIKIASGMALNAGHNNGWSDYNVGMGEELLVYVKNSMWPVTQFTVRAGIPYKSIEDQFGSLFITQEKVFRFCKIGYEPWFASIHSDADAYGLNYEIWIRAGGYAE